MTVVERYLSTTPCTVLRTPDIDSQATIELELTSPRYMNHRKLYAIPSTREFELGTVSETVSRSDGREAICPSESELQETLFDERATIIGNSFFVVPPKFPHSNETSLLLVQTAEFYNNDQIPHSVCDLPPLLAQLAFQQTAQGIEQFVSGKEYEEISFGWTSGRLQSLPMWHGHITFHDVNHGARRIPIDILPNERLKSLQQRNKVGVRVVQSLFDKLKEHPRACELLSIKPRLYSSGTLELITTDPLPQFIAKSGYPLGRWLQEELEDSYRCEIEELTEDLDLQRYFLNRFCGAIVYWQRDDPYTHVSIHAAMQMEQDIKPVGGIEEAKGNMLSRESQRASDAVIRRFHLNARELATFIAGNNFESDRYRQFTRIAS